MSEDATPDPIQKIIEQHCAELMEHCDACRIFVSRNDSGKQETAGNTTGGGNYYAQLGQIEQWLISQRQHVRNETPKDDED
jgi:hypothetical protein